MKNIQKTLLKSFLSPHFKLWYGYEMYYIPDSMTQNEKKKIIQRSVVWSFYLHRMLKFIIAHHHYVIIVYFWFLILSYDIYLQPVVGCFTLFRLVLVHFES